MKRAVIFAGGTIADYSALPVSITNKDYIICADSGIVHCENMSLSADLWVGDFDSSDFDTYSKLDAACNAKVIRLNRMKDDTDTEYALDCAIERGYTKLVLVAGIGSRFDHSIANALLAEKYFDKGACLTIVNEKNAIRFAKNTSIDVSKGKFRYVSVIPLEDSVISCEGFLYPLCFEVLRRDSTRGISNELTKEKGIVTVHSGCALVVESID